VKRLLDAPTPEAGVSIKRIVLPSTAYVTAVLNKYPVLRYSPETELYYWSEQRYRYAATRLYASAEGPKYFSVQEGSFFSSFLV